MKTQVGIQSHLHLYRQNHHLFPYTECDDGTIGCCADADQAKNGCGLLEGACTDDSECAYNMDGLYCVKHNGCPNSEVIF